MPSSADAPHGVFISYSHDSEKHRDLVLDLADRLREGGLHAWIDQYEDHQDDWPRWMQDQINEADTVLVVCTETYRRRFDGHETKGGLGVDWEGRLLLGELYHRNTKKIVAVVFSRDEVEHIPKALRNGSWYDVGSADGYDKLYRVLTAQPETPPRPVGKVKEKPPKRRRSTSAAPTSPLPSTAASAEPEAITMYRAWADARHRHLELIGLGADDVQIELDEVFVPVRISIRSDDPNAMLGGLGGRRSGMEEAIDLGEIFRARADGDRPHALLFGEPGSGKTTALRKLHRLARDPVALGLGADTVPIFFRLRQWTPDRLGLPMGEVLDYELREVSGTALPVGVGSALWERGHLLLLLDGLDEIGDEVHRAKVLARLVWHLKKVQGRSIRAVISTRRSGWTEATRQVETESFSTLVLRPFDDEQIASLVQQWFQAVSDAGFIDDGVAATRSGVLLSTLKERGRSNQRLQVLVSTPMLLTLLCVVVMRGGEVPRRRVDFYEECLTVLVGRWRQQVGREAPVSAERALSLAGELAWHLHRARRRDNLRYMEAVGVLFKRLGNRQQGQAVFDWLLRDAGLLTMVTDRQYGFAHLGLQEHLTARHLTSHMELLDEICDAFGDSWWAEVFPLVAALPGGHGFAPLMQQLLSTDAPRRRADLIRQCLQETDAPDLSPFLDLLRASSDPEEQASTLLLLRGHSDPEIREAAEALEVTSSPPTLRAAARSYLDSVDSPSDGASLDVVVVHGGVGDEGLEILIGALKGRSLRVEPFASMDSERWWSKLVGHSRMLIAVGPGEADWSEVVDSLFDDSIARIVVRLPGDDPRPSIPPALSALPVCELQRFDDVSTLDALAADLRTPPVEPSPEPKADAPAIQTGNDDEAILHELTTGEDFLLVPASRYRRGAAELPGIEDKYAAWARPEHWVQVSRFWLARTPVTNRQYALFLDQAADREEPRLWRDRRFSDPSQPVVAVTWEDAVAYCEWLTNLRDDGRVYRLPREAEWELAARGTDERSYPWGHDEPTGELACFGLDSEKDGPASVGSCPGGAGPFGHHDLAGSVWEWCADAWEENYDRWAKEEPVDPVEEADPELRPVRGGSWRGLARYLWSAFRGGVEPGLRDGDVGFRVLCAPASK